ncbi:MAG: hypothetical protein LQ349_000125 [Xanthoria aureola]|nr:MAG: hypothetical protein LQ349_000125 [Xanthoria aureola]
MFLKRHVCRFAAIHPTDHIWISDDILDHALSRYIQLRVGRRHGSAVPGPLEARKRAAKRRMMGLAPTIRGFDPHPGLLAGLGRGQENQRSWQWQHPKPPQPKQSPRSLEEGNGLPSDSAPLPAWLTDYDNHHEKVAAAEERINKPVGNVDSNEGVQDSDYHTKPKTQDHDSPATLLKDNTNIDSIRNIIKSIQEHDPMRKTCSRLALRQLLDLGCDMEKILEFWVDPLLNPWRAGNLPLFVAHCVEFPKVDEMMRFCEWTVRQFHVGACPDRNILVLIIELSSFREQDNWEEHLLRLCQNVAQALRSSPVLRVEDIAFETYSSLLAVLFDDIYSLSSVELGLDLVKSSSFAQLQDFSSLVRPTIERWVHMWEPSRSAELSSMTMSSTITSLLCMMPKFELLDIVRDVSWRILNLSIPAQDSRILWQKHSLWWSAIRAPEIFQHIKKSSFWPDISDAICKTQEEAIESMALTKVNEHLNQNALQAAYRTFLQHPQLSLESCPHLAEALILDPNRDWKTALMLRESRQAVVLAKQQSTGIAKHLQHDRVRLLERMASAYAQQEHIPAAMIFYYAHGCWKIHERDNLGPVGPAMTHALTLCGVVRPLQAGRQVSRTRMEWILRMVAEVEGVDLSIRLGAAVHDWLNEGYRQAKSGRDEVFRQSLSWQHHEQSLRVQGTDPWDGLTAMAQARPDAPPCHGQAAQSTYRAGRVIDLHLAASTDAKGRVKSQEAPLMFLKDEDDNGEPHLTEETFMSALASETASFVESINSNPVLEVSDAASQYIVPKEGQPPATALDELEYGPEHNAHHSWWSKDRKSQVRDGSHGAAYVSTTAPSNFTVNAVTEELHSGTNPKDVHRKRTRDEALNQRVRERRVHALVIRLNATRILGPVRIGTSTSPLEHSCLPERSFISPSAAMLSAADPAQLDKVSMWRQGILGSQDCDWPLLRHGMKEYRGPTTFGSAREPALGAGLLRVQWVLESVARGEKHLTLGVPENHRVETQDGRNGMVQGGA